MKRIKEVLGDTLATELAVKAARADFYERLANGESCDSFCQEWFGLEPDYLDEILG